MVEYSGKSESTFIREMLLSAEVKESQSFNSGYYSAFNTFEISCCICGETMIIDLNNDLVAISKIKEKFGNIAHKRCTENQERQQEAEQQQKFKETYNW